MFSEIFPPAIYPAILISLVVAMRMVAYAKRRDGLQLGRGLTELILAAVYWIEFFRPFSDFSRANIIRNTIMLIYSVELFYQIFILPKLRRLNDGISK